MHLSTRGSWLCLGLACLGLATFAQAQDRRLIRNDQIERFNKIRFNEFIPLVKGDVAINDSNKKTVELGAEVMVFPVTMTDKNTNAKFMDQVRKDFDKTINEMLDKANVLKNKDFRKQFSKHLIRCFKEVFDLPILENRVGCTNAAILLPKLARLQEEEIGDFLADLIRDPKKHDNIKLYALKGLAFFFPASEWTVRDPANGTEQRKKRDIERVKVIMDYLDRKWEPSQADDDAIPFLRQAAIRTLAQAQVPAVVDKEKIVVAPVIDAFLKVLDPKTTMKPAPSLQEKLEAAIGICQIKNDPNSLYLPDMGIYLVGKFLVDFANEYKTDHARNAVPGKFTKPGLLPWKADADRLILALTDQVKNTDNIQVIADANKNAKTLLSAALPLLKQMKAHEKLDNLGDLGLAVTEPKSAEIFRGITRANGKK